MARTLSPHHLRAWRALLTAHARALAAVEQEVTAGGGLPLVVYDVLLALEEAPERRLRMHELADRLLLSRSGTTRLVDRVHRQGLIERKACPEDRRGQLAVLTRAGAAALRRTWPLYRRAIAARFSPHLSEHEATELARVLERVAAAAPASARRTAS